MPADANGHGAEVGTRSHCGTFQPARLSKNAMRSYPILGLLASSAYSQFTFVPAAPKQLEWSEPAAEEPK